MDAADLSARWANVAGYGPIKARLDRVWAGRGHWTSVPAWGLANPAGVLLEGLPGCGKTLIARALAGSGGRVVVPGEVRRPSPDASAASVRTLFERAAATAPAVLVLDDLDLLIEGDDPVSCRLRAELRTLLEHAPSTGVLAIGCVQVAAALPVALRRAGRFDHSISVMPPTPGDRVAIVEHHIRAHEALELGSSVDLEAFASATPLTTGADLAAIVRNAAHAAVGPSAAQIVIEQHHLRHARAQHRRSLSLVDIQRWLEEVREFPGNEDGALALERDIEAFRTGRSELAAMDVSELLPGPTATNVPVARVLAETRPSPVAVPSAGSVDRGRRPRATEVFEVEPDPRWDPSPANGDSSDNP